jgi:choline-sulfatase
MPRFLRSVVLAALAGLTFAAPVLPAAHPPGSDPAAVRRPNFLFILVDDQSPFDFKFYNPRSELHSPTLDRLAARGMVLDRAYYMGGWVGGVCTPSRTMVMSGRTLWHIPDASNRGYNPHNANPRLVPPDLPQHTLPAVFNRAGYATMRTCKPGNSYQAANALFQVRRDADKRGGTDETGSAWHADQVLTYLQQREASRDARPFLIYFGFSHPHDTRDGKPGYLAKYGATNHTDRNSPPPAHPQQPLLPAAYLPAHPFDQGNQPGQRDETQASGVWERRDERTIRNELGREFACVENIDTQIDRVLRRLEAMGELDNTYIFYTADNGIAIGRHGIQGKQNLYEHSWRVPFLACGPGIPRGARAPGNIYLLDVLATLCDFAGIAPPATNEGRSFRAVLEGRQPAIRDTLYGVFCGGTRPGIRAVRHGDWKLIQYDVHDGRGRETQLFNLRDNPDELLLQHHDPAIVALTGHRPAPHQVNLAADPRHAAKLREMQDRLFAEMRRHDDPFRLWNQPADNLPRPPEPALPPPAKGKARKTG